MCKKSKRNPKQWKEIKKAEVNEMQTEKQQGKSMKQTAGYLKPSKSKKSLRLTEREDTTNYQYQE